MALLFFILHLLQLILDFFNESKSKVILLLKINNNSFVFFIFLSSLKQLFSIIFELLNEKSL